MEVRARREPRLVLVAEALSVGGFAAWATVIVPHAQREVGLDASVIALALVFAGVLAATTMLAAARIAPDRRLPALLIGALTLGAGLLSSTVGVTTPGLLTSLAPVAIGLGLVAALSQPGDAPRFAVAQLGIVAAAAAAGVLLALWLVAAGAEYRTVFVLGGVAALGAVVPILRLEGAASPALVRAVGWRAARFAGWTALLLALAQFIHRTPLLEADKAGFEALHGLGATPEIVEKLLVEPSLRNYVIIVILASLIGARLWGRTTPGRTLLLVAGSGHRGVRRRPHVLGAVGAPAAGGGPRHRHDQRSQLGRLPVVPERSCGGHDGARTRHGGADPEAALRHVDVRGGDRLHPAGLRRPFPQRRHPRVRPRIPRRQDDDHATTPS